jgi:phosphopentomutase
MKRAVIVVIDSCGAGAMPDAKEYNDLDSCNTLGNVAKANNGLSLPTFEKMGLGNIIDVMGVAKTDAPIASHGIMSELSKGKDTTTGHWEIAGLVLDEAFKTYPDGFPDELTEKFIKETGCNGILANVPASGTAVIDDFGDEHVKTKFPIIYTSADSVYQIACHVDVIPLETLYKWCEIARKLLDEKDYSVSRVIARPFKGVSGNYTRVSADRRDYSVPPFVPTVLNNVEDAGGQVIGIGKIEDIYVKEGVTHAVHTGTNKQGLDLTLQALNGTLNLDEIAIKKVSANVDKQIIFTNLVDTDMLFGHRNDAKGYGDALVEIDAFMPEILKNISEDDILIITADHGCDPTVPGSDHTREMVPVIVYSPKITPKDLGQRQTFADIAKTVAIWLDVPYDGVGTSLI